MNGILGPLILLTVILFAALYGTLLVSPQGFVALVLILVGGLFAAAIVAGAISRRGRRH